MCVFMCSMSLDKVRKGCSTSSILAGTCKSAVLVCPYSPKHTLIASILTWRDLHTYLLCKLLWGQPAAQKNVSCKTCESPRTAVAASPEAHPSADNSQWSIDKLAYSRSHNSVQLGHNFRKTAGTCHQVTKCTALFTSQVGLGFVG